MRFRRSLLFVSAFLLMQPAWAQAPVSSKVSPPRAIKSFSADVREADDRPRNTAGALRRNLSK